MTPLTAEESRLERLRRQQVETICAAVLRWKEINSQLVELHQQKEDRRPGMRALLAAQGAATVREAERIVRDEE